MPFTFVPPLIGPLPRMKEGSGAWNGKSNRLTVEQILTERDIAPNVCLYISIPRDRWARQWGWEISTFVCSLYIYTHAHIIQNPSTHPSFFSKKTRIKIFSVYNKYLCTPIYTISPYWNLNPQQTKYYSIDRIHISFLYAIFVHYHNFPPKP